MKRFTVLFFFVLVFPFLLAGCFRRLPASAGAREKLENAGYTVTVRKIEMLASEAYTDGQIVMLDAENGEKSIQIYFFRTKADTDKFYRSKREDLQKNVEAFHKFDFLICRGSAAAMEDFLGE